jgi:hypothetical protein
MNTFSPHAQHSVPADSAHQSPPEPVEPDSTALARVLKEITNQATASVVVGAVGIFFFGIIFGPFAIYRGSKAHRLMRENDIGWEYERRAKLGRTLGFIALGLWSLWMLLNLATAITRA